MDIFWKHFFSVFGEKSRDNCFLKIICLQQFSPASLPNKREHILGESDYNFTTLGFCTNFNCFSELLYTVLFFQLATPARRRPLYAPRRPLGFRAGHSAPATLEVAGAVRRPLACRAGHFSEIIERWLSFCMFTR